MGQIDPFARSLNPAGCPPIRSFGDRYWAAMDTAAATEVPVKPADGLHDFARGPVLAIAAGTTLLLVAVSWRYGYHRDELYFLEASRHLAFGYVDQPPGAVLVAWISRVLLGNTLVGLRLIPALVDGVV